VKTNASGSVSVQVRVERNGANALVETKGSSSDREEVEQWKQVAQHFIGGQMGQESLDLLDPDADAWFRSIAGKIKDIHLLGPELTLGRVGYSDGSRRISASRSSPTGSKRSSSSNSTAE